MFGYFHLPFGYPQRVFLLQFQTELTSPGLVFFYVFQAPKLVLANFVHILMLNTHYTCGEGEIHNSVNQLLSVCSLCPSGSFPNTQTEYIKLLVWCFFGHEGQRINVLSIFGSSVTRNGETRVQVSYCFFRV